MIRSLLLLALVPAIVSAQMPGEAVPEDAMVRAEAAMTEFSQTLRTTLTDTIARDGVVAAIAVCAKEAPAIAAKVGQAHGVRIGRTSHRARNPANAPDHWQRGALERFSLSVAQGRRPETLSHRAVELGRAQFARGIPVEAACLACHGPKESLAEGVAEALAKQYPLDQATGFQVGDLRGLLWVEVDLVPPTGATTP